MNKNRLNEFETIVNEMRQLLEKFQILREQEQVYFENIPEPLKETERAEKSEEYIYNMEEIESDFEDVISRVDEDIVNLF